MTLILQDVASPEAVNTKPSGGKLWLDVKQQIH